MPSNLHPALLEARDALRLHASQCSHPNGGSCIEKLRCPYCPECAALAALRALEAAMDDAVHAYAVQFDADPNINVGAMALDRDVLDECYTGDEDTVRRVTVLPHPEEEAPDA